MIGRACVRAICGGCGAVSVRFFGDAPARFAARRALRCAEQNVSCACAIFFYEMARTRDTTKPASAAAPAASSPSLAASSAPLPLRARSVDALLAFWFVLFAFSTTFTDLHNFTASYLGVEVSQLKGMTLLWPPRVLTQLYFHWAETVDPLLYQNPVWWCVPHFFSRLAADAAPHPQAAAERKLRRDLVLFAADSAAAAEAGAERRSNGCPIPLLPPIRPVRGNALFSPSALFRRQCIEWVNLLVLTPFAFVGVVAFLRGSSWVRIPAIVVSSFTLYSLILCIGTTL